MCVFFQIHKQAVDCTQLGQNCIELERANTSPQRTQGLSGRKSLPDQKGMLFIFNKPGNYCFWMKEMNFSIDMIWLDAQSRIIKIEPAVAPETYPKKFCPDQPAEYVIELTSGMAEHSGLSIGQQLKL